MSATPQPPPDEPILLDYAVPQDERNGMAIAALVLGILGLFGCPLVGLIGLALGIIGLMRANALRSRKGRGLAIAGICCGGMSLLLVPAAIAVLLPSLARTREITKQAVCAANLMGIGQGLKVYSNDNSGWYPVAPFTETPSASGNAHAVTFIGQMANNLMQPNSPAQQSTVHPSRPLFMLIIDGTCTPKQFICPSSGDGEDDLRNHTGGAQVAAQPGLTRFDFRGYPYLSYGYQLPFGPHARPHETLDAHVAIMADKGPFFQAGRGAIGYESWTTADALRPGITGEISISAGASAGALMMTGDHTWRPYNSRNHNSEGQNVLSQDGCVQFQKRPIVGARSDNIYTMQAGYTLEKSLLGKAPADLQGPLAETDSVIVP